MTYFHCCPILIADNSIILPGNWGRILKMYNRNGVSDVLMREYVLEKIRSLEFAQKPSRLNCIFACSTEEQARDYLRRTQRNTEIIYEVEAIQPETPIHMGDYGRVSPPDKYFESIEECARNYWRGNNIELQEIVIGSGVRVVRRVQ